MSKRAGKTILPGSLSQFLSQKEAVILLLRLGDRLFDQVLNMIT